MSLSVNDIKGLSFGYLTGGDLLQWCTPQYLQKQYEIDSNSLQKGVNQAISEAISSFATRYDLTAELSKTGNIQPTALAILSDGVISSITILVPGNNYTSNPTVNIVGGGGSGATTTATISSGGIATITVTNGGSGFTSLPYISFSGGQTNDTRAIFLVKILSILALNNILGSMTNLSEKMVNDITWANKTVKSVRDGQQNLPLPQAQCAKVSNAGLICDSFSTLG